MVNLGFRTMERLAERSGRSEEYGIKCHEIPLHRLCIASTECGTRLEGLGFGTASHSDKSILKSRMVFCSLAIPYKD